MKNIIGILIVLLVVSACNKEQQKTQITAIRSKNALVPEKLIVMDNVLLIDTLDRGWVKGFNTKKFLSAIYDAAKLGKLNIYCNSTAQEAYKTNDINDIISKNYQIQMLAFEEDWFFDAEGFQLYKTVNSYFPVNISEKGDGDNKMKEYRSCFTIKNDTSTKGDMKLLAKNICYEFSLSKESPNNVWIENLNTETFVKLLIDNALSGKVKTYSAINTKTALSIDELKMALNVEQADTVMIEDISTGELKQSIITSELDYNKVKSVIFIEDWYYNDKTFSIEKKVKAIAPVSVYDKCDGETTEEMKEILYVIYTGTDRPVLL